MGRREDGKLIFSLGPSRSFKTQFVFNQMRHDRRALVWDAKGEFAAKLGFQRVAGREQLFNTLRAAPGDARIAYSPTFQRDEYDFFCRCAMTWVKVAPFTLVAEELAQVTNPGKAVGWWGVLLNQALGYGMNIYALGQRGQIVDKDTLGNASVVNICRQNNKNDALYLCERFGLSLSDIPNTAGEMLQRGNDGSLKKSRITFDNEQQLVGKLVDIPAFTATCDQAFK